MYSWLWSFLPLIFCGLMFWMMMRTPMDGDARMSPLDELRKRYAAGEIDTAEFERRRGVLERDQLVTP